MKNKIYKSLFAIGIVILMQASLAGAQTTIYYENFDGTIMTFPAGWSADTANGGWRVDSTNVDTLTGASGHQNIVISNATGLSGIYNLTSKSISTTGYNNISVLWDARLTKHFRDSGSTIQSFDFSTDNGGTWTSVTYTENPSNGSSNWMTDNGGSRINLPGGAANQASLEFRWVASLSSTSSGTYRIDDFNVEGNSAVGIKEYKNQEAFNVYIDAGKFLHLRSTSSASLPASCFITVSDITGRVCLNEKVISDNSIYSIAEFNRGIYFVKITSGNDLLFAQKILCN